MRVGARVFFFGWAAAARGSGADRGKEAAGGAMVGKALSCAEFASPYGEGRYRFTPNTAAFTDTSRRCRRVGVKPNDPKEDEYTVKVGPGSYLGPGSSVDTGTSSDWPRAILPRDAETLAAATAIQPQIAFDIEKEDKRGWNWDSVEGRVVQNRLSFYKAKRYNNACMPKPETAPCSVDYYDREHGHRYLEAREGPEQAGRAAFVSKADRWKQRAGEAPDGADGPGSGPGMYGVPVGPTDDTFHAQQLRMQRRKSTGDDTRSASFRQHTAIRRRPRRKSLDGAPKTEQELRDAELRGGDHDPHRGPGMYWSKSFEEFGRPKSAESVRGTSGFAASGRKDTKLEKDIAKWRANMPTAHFDLRRESRCWSASGSSRRLGGAGALVSPAPSCLLTGAGTAERFPMQHGKMVQESTTVSRARLIREIDEIERRWEIESSRASASSRRTSRVSSAASRGSVAFVPGSTRDKQLRSGARPGTGSTRASTGSHRSRPSTGGTRPSTGGTGRSTGSVRMMMRSRSGIGSIEQDDRLWFDHTGNMKPPATDQVDPHDLEGRTYWEISRQADVESDEEHSEEMHQSGATYSGDDIGTGAG